MIFCFISSVVVVVLVCAVISPSYALNANNTTIYGLNQDAVLGCIDDLPINSISWLRNGVNLTSGSKYVIGETTLTVKNVGQADVGVYICQNKDLRTASAIIYSTPMLNSLPQSVSLVEGDTLVINCTGWGYPTPWLYSWASDKKGMINQNTDARVSTANGSLTMVNITRDDQAHYTCTMMNDVGNGNVTTYVRVNDRLAALWPFIGIVVEVVLVVVIIVVVERKNRAKVDKAE